MICEYNEHLEWYKWPANLMEVIEYGISMDNEGFFVGACDNRNRHSVWLFIIFAKHNHSTSISI